MCFVPLNDRSLLSYIGSYSDPHHSHNIGMSLAHVKPCLQRSIMIAKIAQNEQSEKSSCQLSSSTQRNDYHSNLEKEKSEINLWVGYFMFFKYYMYSKITFVDFPIDFSSSITCTTICRVVIFVIRSLSTSWCSLLL